VGSEIASASSWDRDFQVTIGVQVFYHKSVAFVVLVFQEIDLAFRQHKPVEQILQQLFEAGRDGSESEQYWLILFNRHIFDCFIIGIFIHNYQPPL